MRPPTIRLLPRTVPPLNSFILWLTVSFLFGITAPAFAGCTGTSTSTTCTSATGLINLSSVSGNTDSTPGKASIYPITNTVSGLSGTITSVRVRLNGLTALDPDDLDMMLESPDGRRFVFWSDIGGTRNSTICSSAQCSITNFTITVSDAGSSPLPDGNGAVGRDPSFLANNMTYQPANGGLVQDTFPTATTGNFTLTLANFAQNTANTTSAQGLNGAGTFANIYNGSSTVNGDWKLYIISDSFGGTTSNASLLSYDLLITTQVNNAATTTTVSGNPNPSFVGGSVTITANVTSTSTVTLGTVNFSDGATVIASNVPVNASGVATTTTSALTEGTHTISASYSGATGFAASSGSFTQTVNRQTTVNGSQFCNTGPISISSSFSVLPLSTPYPSRMFVSGLSGNISKVTLTINGFSYPSTSDIDLLLLNATTGAKMVPMAWPGGASVTSNANITLDDDAANALPSSGSLTSGTYRPTANSTTSVNFPSPAPASPWNFAAPAGSSRFRDIFTGVPNGTWELYVATHGGTSSTPRQISGGWCLTFTTTSSPATTTTTSVTPTPSSVNQSVTVAATVTNASNGQPVNALGSVSFLEGATQLAGPLNLDALGTASFAKSDFAAGAHIVTANYSGSPGNFNISSGQVTHYVDTATSNPSTNRYCNASGLTFANVQGSGGSPYPTRILVPSLAGALSKVTLSLNGFSHQLPDDMDMMLSGPNGGNLVVLSDVGGTTAVSNLNLTLDDAAASSLPNSTALAAGTFKPTDIVETGIPDVFPAPASSTFSSASTSTLATVFPAGISPAGYWTLWTVTDSAGTVGGGSLSGGWCINLTMTPPVLSISKTHSGNFSQGQTGATYTVTVGNNGPGSTAGTITVVEAPPTGLTVTAMSGSNWTCSVGTLTCTTTSAVAAGGTLPPITVTVSVAANASSPLVNSVSVSGGGSSGSVTANDSTTIVSSPDLTITKATSSSFIQGGTATYTVSVTNSGAGATTSSFTVTDPLPTGVTAGVLTLSAPWDCAASTQTTISCTYTGTLNAAASTTAISINVNIASNAPASITNTATVSGGGETNTSNNTSSVTSSVTQLTPVTINVPAGVTYSFNGQSLTGTQTVNVAPGTYTLSTTTPQSLGAGVRAVFSNWSDAGAIAHSVVVGSTALSITGNFTTQYQLTVAASPANGGTVTPASGTFFDSGTVVNVSATANSGFVFANWTGPVANANSASTTVTVDAAKSITANFTAQTGVTITVPAGVSYTFNGQLLTGTQTVNVAPGTYTLSTTTPQSLGAGVRAVFSNWSDAGAIAHSVVVGSTALSITGNFTTQYQLTVAASPANGGTVTPASGTFFDSGTVVNVTAAPANGFAFSSWTGPVANSASAATTVTMSAAASVTANFVTAIAPVVTGQISITQTVPAFNRATGRFSQTISLTNNGSALTGSAFAFDNLATGYLVYQPSGVTSQTAPAGSPYKETGDIAAGQTISFVVEFTRSGTAALTYTPRVLGGGAR